MSKGPFQMWGRFTDICTLSMKSDNGLELRFTRLYTAECCGAQNTIQHSVLTLLSSICLMVDETMLSHNLAKFSSFDYSESLYSKPISSSSSSICC